MSNLLGLRLSSGMSLGVAWVIHHEQNENKNYDTENSAIEIEKLTACLVLVDQDLAVIEEKSRLESIDQAEIIATHRLLLKDPEWLDQINNSIQNENLSAPDAVKKVTAEFSQMMLGLDDAYLRERAHDIEDIGQRLVRHLFQEKETVLMPAQGEYILVAKDLTPSEFASLDKKRILGLVTEQGGVTSHTAIMARLYEIPALSGIENATGRIKNNDRIFLQADKSDLYVNPSDDLLKTFQENVKDYQTQKTEMLKLKETQSVTADGIKVHLEANIGRESDLELVQKYNAEGVGLFRTEFLFFDRTQAPSENEQFETYKKIGLALHPHPVVVRTFDIGADKQVSYLKWPKEENPFLGLRAIRYCLKSPGLFHTQLRALFKASHYTPLSIMFPMISSIEELEQAKEHVEICKKQIIGEGFTPNFKLGIMIEIPAAALIADQLAPLVDFFSIGTNDLIQYVCAVDRMNEGVAHLYESFHPGVLNLISQVIAAGKKHNTQVAMCGEMAADLDLIPLLIGMGLRTFSQSPATVLRSKHLIQSLNTKECEKLWSQTKGLGKAASIQKLCVDFKVNLVRPVGTH